MTFLYGTNVECLYSMPALAATVATATKQIASGTTSTCPQCVLPPLQNIWPVSQMPGKAFRISGRGGYDYGSATGVLFQLYADTGFSGATNLLAATASVTCPTSALGSWEFDIDMTCVGSGNNSGGGTAQSTWYTSGHLLVGTGTSATAAMMGATVTTGVPQTVVLACNSVYTMALYVTPATAPTSFGMSQFLVYGVN